MSLDTKSPHYSVDKKKYMNLPSKRQYKSLGVLEGIGVITKLITDQALRIPAKKLPEVKPNFIDFMKEPSEFQFIWFGHSTLLLKVEGKTILIDPVFSDYAFSMDILVKRFQAPVAALSELPSIDYIVISHNHYDHLDEKTITFFKDSATQFLVPLGVAADMIPWGIKPEKIKELDWHQSYQADNITFTATPAQHSSGRGLCDFNKTLWASWVIEGRKDKIFYSGDSGYGEHFKQIGDKYGPFDVTFIENGQYHEKWLEMHMLPTETIQAWVDLNGKVLVPVHWGMFDLALHKWDEPVKATYEFAKNWHIPFIAPKIGQTVHLDDSHGFKPWWLETQDKPVEAALKIPVEAL